MSALTEGQTPTPLPTIGRIVHYRLADWDVAAINSERHANDQLRGNQVVEGQAYPATVVRTFGGHTVNLQVHLDGNHSYWATSRVPGDDNGQWCWPARG